MNTQAIATHLNILDSAIIEVQEWASVLWVKFVGGVRFVSKKIGVNKVTAQIKRTTWDYGDNFDFWLDGAEVESWSTKNFTVNGFLVHCAEKYNLKREDIEICEGVDNNIRPTIDNHQSRLALLPPSRPAYDPRIESNDLDPEEEYLQC